MKLAFFYNYSMGFINRKNLLMLLLLTILALSSIFIFSKNTGSSKDYNNSYDRNSVFNYSFVKKCEEAGATPEVMQCLYKLEETTKKKLDQLELEVRDLLLRNESDLDIFSDGYTKILLSNLDSLDKKRTQYLNSYCELFATGASNNGYMAINIACRISDYNRSIDMLREIKSTL